MCLIDVGWECMCGGERESGERGKGGGFKGARTPQPLKQKDLCKERTSGREHYCMHFTLGHQIQKLAAVSTQPNVRQPSVFQLSKYAFTGAQMVYFMWSPSLPFSECSVFKFK